MSERQNKERENVRDVHVGTGPSTWNDGLNFQETLRHDEVDCAGIDEMAAEACCNLPEGLYKGADRDRSHCRGYSRETR